MNLLSRHTALRGILIYLLLPTRLLGEPHRIHPQPVHEQFLSQQAVETLQKDAPLRDLAWENESTLWLLSNSTLWRWHAQKKSLQKIHLGTQAGGLQHILIFGDSYFVATSHALFIVHAAPLQVKKVKIQKTSSSAFLQTADAAYLVTEKAVYQIRTSPDQVQLLYKITFPIENPIFEPEAQALFFTKENQVCRFDFLSNRKETLQVFPAMGSIRNLQLQNKQMVVQFDQVFYHLSLRGEILQTLPVFGDKKILAHQALPTYHSFLFTDHIMEKIPLSPQSASVYYQIPLLTDGEITHLVSHDHGIALLQDGMPRIFQLSTLN